MRLTRSQPLGFERPDGTIILAQPCTRGRMREVLMLDLEPVEDIAARRGEITAIYLRDAEWLKADGKTPAGTLQDLLDDLTAEEEIDIIHGMTLSHHGLSAEDGIAAQQAMREALKKKLQEQRMKSSHSMTAKP